MVLQLLWCYHQNIIGDDETNALQNFYSLKASIKLSKVSNLVKAFANNSSADIKLLKAHISRTIQTGKLIEKLLGPFN